MDINQAKSFLENNGLLLSPNQITDAISPFSIEEFDIESSDDTNRLLNLVRKNNKSSLAVSAPPSKALSKPGRKKKESPIPVPQRLSYVGKISQDAQNSIAINPHEVIRDGKRQIIKDHMNESASAAEEIALVLANTGVIIGTMVSQKLEVLGMSTLDDVIELRQQQWAKAKEENNDFLADTFESFGLPRDLLTRGQENG